MSSTVLDFPPPTFGGDCPECGRSDGILNVGREHWGRCSRHRRCWFIGENLFSGWKGEDPRTWHENVAKMAGFVVVEPMNRRAKPTSAGVHR